MEETYIEEDGQILKQVPVDKDEELVFLRTQKSARESFIAENQVELIEINNKISKLENL